MKARDWRAQNLFLGSRGLNSVERFLIGSVSSAVAAHAPCSVEVVKAKKSGRA
jgi:nucleotide-binding universal stress UspA family protein